MTKNRLVAKFVSHTSAKEKDVIISSYSNPESTIRVLICTVAFRIGMDVPDIRRVIHWLPAEDIENYVQECECVGRDGLPAETLLYFHSIDLTSNAVVVGEDMVQYYSSECRQSLMANIFVCPS